MTSKRGDEHPARFATIGAAITAFGFLDAYTVGLFIAVLAAWLPALIVFAVAAVVLTFINGAYCRSVERQWDASIAGNAKRMEATLAKRRNGRLMHHPVAWITRGSDAWFTLAAILMNPVIVIALARVSAASRSIRARSGWPRPATQSSSRPCFQQSRSPRATRSARHTAGLDTGYWTGASAERGDHMSSTSGGQMPTDTGTRPRDRGSLRAKSKRHRRIEPGALSSAMSPNRQRDQDCSFGLRRGSHQPRRRDEFATTTTDCVRSAKQP